MDLEKNKQRLEILAAEVEELKNSGGGGTPTESDDFTPDNITIEDGGTFPSGSTERLTKHLPLEINDTLYYFLEETDVDYLYGSLPTSGAFPSISYFRVMKGSFTVEFHQTAIETVPTEDSTNLITSGGVYTALQSAGSDLDLRPKLIRTEEVSFDYIVNQDDFNNVIVKHLPYKRSENGDEYKFLHDNGSNYIYINTFDTPTADNGSYRYDYDFINKSTRKISNMSPGNGFTVVNSRNILDIFFNGYYTGGNNTFAIPNFPSDLNDYLTPGIYKKSETGAITNCPTEEKAYMEINEFCGLNEKIQKIYTITGTPTVYIRTITNGTLGSWYKFEGTIVS